MNAEAIINNSNIINYLLFLSPVALFENNKKEPDNSIQYQGQKLTNSEILTCLKYLAEMPILHMNDNKYTENTFARLLFNACTFFKTGIKNKEWTENEIVKTITPSLAIILKKTIEQQDISQYLTKAQKERVNTELDNLKEKIKQPLDDLNKIFELQEEFGNTYTFIIDSQLPWP